MARNKKESDEMTTISPGSFEPATWDDVRKSMKEMNEERNRTREEKNRQVRARKENPNG